ncbi:hypothetical protein BT69DRAFT_1338758 [Atractiella rhizophila]|nr:hypothetical protein BT69DRAFT_1338758 [Atractiella rhizophila]
MGNGTLNASGSSRTRTPTPTSPSPPSRQTSSNLSSLTLASASSNSSSVPQAYSPASQFRDAVGHMAIGGCVDFDPDTRLNESSPIKGGHAFDEGKGTADDADADGIVGGPM